MSSVSGRTKLHRQFSLIALVLFVPASSVAQDEVGPVVEVGEAARIVDDAIIVQDVVQGAIIDGAIVEIEGVNDEKALAAMRDAAQASLLTDMKFLLRLELAFAKRACPLDKDQLELVRQKLEERLPGCKDMVMDVAVFRNGFGFGMGGGMATVAATTSEGHSLKENPYSRIQKEMEKTLQELVTPEQLARYQEEVQAKNDFHRQSSVGMVVELIDQRLSLSAEQRQTIRQRLIERWENPASISFEMYFNNPEYIPAVPESAVQPFLNKDQRNIWSRLNRHDFPIQVQSDQFGVFGDE